MSSPKRLLPECWGHRGVSTIVMTLNWHYVLTSDQASAAFPENTLASFEAAIRDGAECIESGMTSPQNSVSILSPYDRH